MHCVKRDSLIKELESIIDISDEDEFPQKKSLIVDLVNQIFDSLHWTEVKENEALNVKILDEWKSRSINEIEFDWMYLEIDRKSIQGALEKHLEKEWLINKDMDWLFVNLLTYSEYIATIDEIRRNLLDFEEFLKMKSSSSIRNHSYNVAVLMKKWWHWPAALGIFSISFLVFPWEPLICGIYIAWIFHNKTKAYKKINAVFESMLQTYLALNTASLGWNNVHSLLTESQKRGAVWDSSVFALVEARL